MDAEQNYLNEDGVERLTRLIEYFETAETATLDSRRLSERDRDYYDNFDDSQWTEAEKKVLRKRKQPITTSNRIKSKFNYLLGVEAQHRSLPRAYPRNPGDEDSANAATDALRFVIEDNRYDRARSAVFKNVGIEGYGGYDIPVVQVGNDIKIKILPIQWDRLFFDPHSRQPDFSDAKYIGQVIWLDAEDAESEYPGSSEIIHATFRSEYGMSDTYEDTPRVRWTDSKRKRVRVVEVWHNEGGKWYHCIYTKGGIISELDSPYVDEEGNSTHGFVLGSGFVDRDGNRYGIVRDWIGIQDEINKRRSKALHLLSVRQTKGEKGAVEDVKKAKDELAKPDGHVEITPGMEFDVLPTGDMAAAQFNLLAEAKAEIDSVGVNAAMTGAESRVMSGRALMKREESGLAELGPLFDALKQLDHSVYRTVWCRIKQFWTAEKWVRVTDDERNVRFVGLNQPITLGEQLLEEVREQGGEVTPDMLNQAKMDPAMQQVVGTRNDVSQMDVDIVIDDAPASASLQAEQFEILASMTQNGLQLPPRALIEASALRNKDKILKLMGDDGENPQVKQMQMQMQQMGQIMDQMKRELESAKTDREIEAQKVKIDAFKAETDRLKELIKGMPPEVQSLFIQQALQQILPSPDILPSGAPQGMHRMPDGSMMPDAAMPPQGGTPMPMMNQQPSPPSAGFLTPNARPMPMQGMQ